MIHKKHRVLKTVGILMLVLFGLAVFGIAWVANLAKDLPNPEQFLSRRVSQSTKIYDRTGQILLYEIHGEEKRTVIAFDQIPDSIKKATIAIEDQNFYNHPAVDWRGIARAILKNLIQGRLAQGGSTITQQLVKNAFLTPERTITRKVKELILARWTEQRYTKDQILNLYLNQIPYGSNAYGVEAASQTYFKKSVKDLNLTESAVLAAIANAPTYYSPWGTHKKELEQRKNSVLDKMFQLGYINEEQRNSAQKYKLQFAPANLGSIKAPHFVMDVREYLNNKYGEDMVTNGGLNVITTLDWNLQQEAEASITDGAKRNSDLYQGKNAALVAQNPKTGQVLALVGSKDYFAPSEPANCVSGQTCQFEGNFNVATQGLRQPGSSFKPFAYITAFEKGYTPDTVVFDLPTEFSSFYDICPLTNINYSNDDPKCFHPENFDETFRGPVTLRNALAQSINVPSVKVLYLAGLSETIKTAQGFGITTLNDPSRYGLSLVLGGGEIKLINMVEAYSVFSQEGIKHEQALILEVKDPNGNVLEKYLDQANQVVEPQYAKMINDILSDSNARSPLFQNSLNLTLFPDRDVALKTGTTNNYKDAWAIGYTPSLVVGVWAGNNDSEPMQKKGGSILAAVPIWHDFMVKALPSEPIESFNRPDPMPEPNQILSGNYLFNGQPHDILFFVNKNNPLGPAPTTPQDDSQFQNWEYPVVMWVSQNTGHFPLLAPTTSTITPNQH